MRIGMFDNVPDGGAKRVMYEQVRGLRALGHEVCVVHTNPDSRFDLAKVASDVLVLPYPVLEGKGWKRLGSEYQMWKKSLELARLAQKWLEEHEVEVVVVHPDRYYQSPPLLGDLKIPSVYYAEEWLRVVYEPEHFRLETIKAYKRGYEYGRRQWIKLKDKSQVKKADVVIANSDFTAQHMRKAYGVDARVIYPGVDTQLFAPSKKRAKKEYFLFVGNTADIDGYPLIHALDTDDHFPFTIVTAGGSARGLQLDDAKLVELYQGAVATLCLSYNEPFGMVAIESMACGTPVIAIDEGGYKETVVEGETGRLVARDVGLLVEAMKQLAVDGETRIQMGKRARQRTVEKFGWEGHVKLLMKAIEDAGKR